MKARAALVLPFAIATMAVPARAQVGLGTGFTYQGRLASGGMPANGDFDFEFRLYDDAVAGGQVGSTLPMPAVPVSAGLFTVALDFGVQFAGQKRWLEVSVRPVGGPSYSTLAPRQELSAAPNALFALASTTAVSATTAGSATSFSGSLAGEVTGSQGATVVTNAVPTNTANAVVRRDAAGDFAAGTLTLAGNLALANTTSASVGVVTKGGAPFLHNFGPGNTFLGSQTGNLTMTGGGNTAVGSLALAANTTGTNNSALRFDALRSNTGGGRH